MSESRLTVQDKAGWFFIGFVAGALLVAALQL